MKRKVISVLLVASMVASVASCSLKKTKFDEDKFIDFMEDEFDFEEVDPDEVAGLVGHPSEYELYFVSDDDETKEIVWDGIEYNDYFGKLKNCESSVTFIVGDFVDRIEIGTLLTFEDEDAAITFMEKTVDAFEDSDLFDDTYSDKNNENAAGEYTQEDGIDLYLCCGAYRSGNMVLCLIGINYDTKYDFDYFDDICEEYDLETIEDLF